MTRNPFEPVALLPTIGNWIKQFFLVWAIVLIPVFGSIMLIVYRNLPIIGIISAYGALVSIIAFIRTKSTKVEINSDLSIKSVRTSPVHPELFKTTLIVNGIFAVEALLLYIALP